jgi:hypothetical protein
MANLDHVSIVKQGAEGIRQWREEQPEERLQLTEANLQGVCSGCVYFFPFGRCPAKFACLDSPGSFLGL